MTAGRPWTPAGGSCRDAYPRSPRAWTGWARRGAAEGVEPAAGDPGPGPGLDREAVAGRAGGLRLGASGRGHPPQQEGAGRGRSAAALPRADRGDRPPSPGRGPVGRGVRALPEGDAELLAGAVWLP